MDDCSVSRLSTETVDPSLRGSLADMVIIIAGRFSYVIETQIGDDNTMGARIVRYILGARQEISSPQERVTRVRLPDARVIYWETSRNTPDRETLVFEFPGGEEQRMEVPSLKFPEYSPARLEEQNMGILLPFCVLNLRKAVRGRVRSGMGLEGLGEELGELTRETKEAAGRSGGRGVIGEGDLATILKLTDSLRGILYGAYTGLEDKEQGMKKKSIWDDLELINYNDVLAEAKVELEKKVTREVTEKVTHELAQKITQEVTRELTQKFAQKLKETGISEEQLAAAGLAL
ncbi:MAG: hypothetical protein LBU00_02850 [Treponema sp.]|nr:hypothetical protein [Treponema sp.]